MKSKQSALTQSRYDVFHDILDEYDGALWLASRVIVDLEAEQSATVHHVLSHRIPSNKDLLRARHFSSGVRNSCYRCK